MDFLRDMHANREDLAQQIFSSKIPKSKKKQLIKMCLIESPKQLVEKYAHYWFLSEYGVSPFEDEDESCINFSSSERKLFEYITEFLKETM